MDEFSTERYRQRYETWRHLDKIRYQTLQLSIAIAGAISLVVRATGIGFPPWLWVVLSIIFFLFWQILAKVNIAILKNGEALRKFGAEVGDDMIPNTSIREKSVFFYIEIAFGVAGLFFFLGFVISAFL
ncbi:hypothetical protein [Yoonia rosea]|uniref:hypothetical protein n=1 Tax=Yoonia rosea TaxID=287098 RepID=UPI001054858D|nr:hypothetical protein [Yoonia rosea]